jgi:polysaccharide export outer membrane protein
MARGSLGLSSLISVLVLAGCTFAPGSDVSDGLFTLNQGKSEKLVPNVMLITPDLVSTSNRIESSTSDSASSTNTESENYVYRIGTGDVLSVVVWDHPELTAPFGSFNDPAEQGNIVDDEGNIFYPYVGVLKVSGLTTAEVRKQITSSLERVIEQPQVDVRVAAFNSQQFVVSGALRTPGRYAVTNIRTSVLDAVGLAGGLNDNADFRNAYLRRAGGDLLIDLYGILYGGDLRTNYEINGGDVLHIPPTERNTVYVFGEVGKPGLQPLTRQNLTLTQALANSGGINEARANGKGIYVLRDSEYPNVIDIYQLDASNAWGFVLGDDFNLLPNDVIYVTATPIGRWNRFVENVFPSLRSVYQLERIVE